jgi:hypothetical protein
MNTPADTLECPTTDRINQQPDGPTEFRVAHIQNNLLPHIQNLDKGPGGILRINRLIILFMVLDTVVVILYGLVWVPVPVIG